MYKQIDSNKRNTVVLIGAFLILVIGLGWALSYMFQSPIILYIAVFIAIFQAWAGYYYSDALALASSGAKKAGKKGEPAYHRTVENLCITAGLPLPRLYIIEDTAINAFATGRDPKHAALAVTRGALTRLENEELEGVLAHELCHVRNYDIRVMTIVVVLVGFVALISDWFLRYMWWGGGRRTIFFIVAIVLAILAPIFAMLLQFAVSRKREYLADASGALLTRYPEGLAKALEKIGKDKKPLEAANRATAHLFIANPLKGPEGKPGWWATVFSTHPPVQDRIAKLRAMA